MGEDEQDLTQQEERCHLPNLRLHVLRSERERERDIKQNGEQKSGGAFSFYFEVEV